VTGNQKSALIIAGLLAAGAVAGLVSGTIKISLGNATTSADLDAASIRAVSQTPMQNWVRVNHSLYRRPTGCGAQRAVIVDKGGWDWLNAPPSEQVL